MKTIVWTTQSTEPHTFDGALAYQHNGFMCFRSKIDGVKVVDKLALNSIIRIREIDEVVE